MIDDIVDARNQIFELLHNAWEATDWMTEIGMAKPNVDYQGRVPQDGPPAGKLPYARAYITHADGFQNALVNFEGLSKYGRIGVVIVQCFAPNHLGNALEIALKMGTIAQRAYESKQTQGCVWFRRCRVQEVGSDKSNWEQANMYAGFTYDEVH